MQTLTNEELWHGIYLLIKNNISQFQEFEQYLAEKYNNKEVSKEIFLAHARTNNTTTNTNTIERKNSMSGINFNANTVAPNVGFAPVPAGAYTVALVKSEFKPTSNGAGKIIEFKAQVQGGAMHGREIMFNLNWENANPKAVEIGHGRLSAICHATGVMQLQDTQQLHNIPFKLTVEVTPDGKYNDIIAIEPVTAQAAPMQAPVQQPVYQQQAPPMQQPVMQPQYQQPTPQAAPQMMPQQQAPNPMAQYEQMAMPQQQAAPQMMPQQLAPQPQPQAVPDWIANQQQMAMQQQQQQG